MQALVTPESKSIGIFRHQIPGTMGADLRRMLRLLSIEEMGLLLELHPNTLARWRVERIGPDYVRLGRSVFYRVDDVLEWCALNVVVTKRVLLRTLTSSHGCMG